MKDKLLYGTIGLLVGIVVMQWTMPSGQAAGTTASGVVAMAENPESNEVYVLDINGHVWSNKPCWSRVNGFDPPMPTSQIKFWQFRGLVTTDDHVWTWAASQAHPEGEYQDCGAWPGSPVGLQQSTLGTVKAKFSAKDGKQ